ncbi:MAG: ISNCY family transposase [Acidobacteria bacterium]|nr:ISNCY family transposase [Acidobacteriota bacterium]
MVRRRKRERSLFEVLLPDGHKLWPDWLRRMDTLLEDDAVIDVVTSALEARWPQSRRRGRPGTPAEIVIRLLILKHLFDWSYDDLEQEVRANLVYRAFTRSDADEVPDAKTILKIARVLGPDVIEQLHRQVVEVAKRAGVTRGRRFRVDTTVVETNVHYPTDSTLMQDGVRVLTRTMQRASAALGDQPGRIRHRLRSVTRRVLQIGYQARSPKTREALVESYRKLMATTRAVLRDADTMVRRLSQRRRTATAGATAVLQRAQQQLQQMRPLVGRVVAQARARLIGGDTHVPNKVLSLFEPHTTTIRKGKIAKPNEFGNLVTVQEAEGQIITAFEVHAGRPADVTLWTRALDRHVAIFGRAPHLAAGDRGFSSAANEHAATTRGVRRVVLPRRGPKTPARRAFERQAWFRRGQRWRVGCEGRISVIKRRHGLRRCRYHGTDGMARWVGLGVIADNLMNTARFANARNAA